MLKSISIGLISDTHGLLRPEAIEALRGSDYIIHTGDIGPPKILKQLGRLAPVTAVRGNCDEGWTSAVLPPETAVLAIGGLRLLVIHSTTEADLDYSTAGYDVVVSGHTHVPEAVVEDGVLFVNPGSAGPIRPGKPVSVGRLVIEGNKVTPHLITLEVPANLPAMYGKVV